MTKFTNLPEMLTHCFIIEGDALAQVADPEALLKTYRRKVAFDLGEAILSTSAVLEIFYVYRNPGLMGTFDYDHRLTKEEEYRLRLEYVGEKHLYSVCALKPAHKKTKLSVVKVEQ